MNKVVQYRRLRCVIKTLLVGLSIQTCQATAAWAFRSVAFTPAMVSVTTDDGSTIEVALKSFPDLAVTGFSDMAMTSDRRHIGWEVEETVAGVEPTALAFFVMGPHTRLEISEGEQIHSWKFLSSNEVNVCFGPTHGPQLDHCMTYALPD